jgi:hypothetical protein
MSRNSEQRREKSRVKIEDFLESRQFNSFVFFVSFVVKGFFGKAVLAQATAA